MTGLLPTVSLCHLVPLSLSSWPLCPLYVPLARCLLFFVHCYNYSILKPLCSAHRLCVTLDTVSLFLLISPSFHLLFSSTVITGSFLRFLSSLRLFILFRVIKYVDLFDFACSSALRVREICAQFKQRV